jgi:hypothetical protein
MLEKNFLKIDKPTLVFVSGSYSKLYVMISNIMPVEGEEGNISYYTARCHFLSRYDRLSGWHTEIPNTKPLVFYTSTIKNTQVLKTLVHSTKKGFFDGIFKDPQD